MTGPRVRERGRDLVHRSKDNWPMGEGRNGGTVVADRHAAAGGGEEICRNSRIA